ncbi:hypothetical protein [Vibrio mangrovi]|uniref:Uncharacterized protein n=1 Tax=Vibrio mangrovi TaxID=474394 RepID=A0A1Y6J1D8_9VIBR|nr:hypothetical protein [Vibrio mangrovi]MDW6005427.1 hypothetical protein [Vibrio mangrovi]SMS02133.1 hypothetical protein VIM7927_03451 [Vibrio mangrovi]
MSNETIRTNLVDALNEMNKLLEVCEDEDQQYEIRIQCKTLFQQLDRVIVATLDAGAAEYKDALSALKDLTSLAVEGKKDLEKMYKVIEKAADVIEKVEKLVKHVTRLLS